VIKILILAEQTLDSECYGFGDNISVGAMISLGLRPCFAKRVSRRPELRGLRRLLTATHHTRGQIFGGNSHRRFHHQRCRNDIVITIPLSDETCSRSRWNRGHFPVEAAFMMRWKPAITMRRNMQLLFFDFGAINSTIHV
jgi:hypothetical protein